MNRFHIAFIFLFSAGCVTEAVPVRPSLFRTDARFGVFTVRDEFTGVISYQSDEFLARQRSMPNTLEAMWILHSSSVGIQLTLWSESFDSWDYLSCHKVVILADGIVVSTTDSSWNGFSFTRDRRELVHETIDVEFDLNSANDIAAASHVQIRYCDDVMEYSRDVQWATYEMIRRLNSPQ